MLWKSITDVGYSQSIAYHSFVHSAPADRKIHNDVSEKQQAIARIEASVAVIHQLFLDLALLTEHQGSLLDQIEYQLDQANDNIEQGNEELYKSLEYSKKIRKKRMYVCDDLS